MIFQVGVVVLAQVCISQKANGSTKNPAPCLAKMIMPFKCFHLPQFPRSGYIEEKKKKRQKPDTASLILVFVTSVEQERRRSLCNTWESCPLQQRLLREFDGILETTLWWLKLNGDHDAVYCVAAGPIISKLSISTQRYRLHLLLLHDTWSSWSWSILVICGYYFVRIDDVAAKGEL